jgi:alpha-L-fucosidase
MTWRSTDELIRTLIDCVSKGGNLLLNVGPTGRGEFDYRALDRLKGIGEWMHYNSRSIYGCTQAPDEFKCPRDCRLTYNPDTRRLYVHVHAWPYKHLYLDGKAYVDRVEYAQLLHDASEVQIKGLEDWQVKRANQPTKPELPLLLPQVKPNVTIPVIELFLK